MRKQGRKWLMPLIIFLIGMILMTLSFALWFYTVAPVTSLGTYVVERKQVTNSTGPSGIFVEYFGSDEQKKNPYNASRPVDCSLNTTLTVTLSSENGPAQILVYVGDRAIFDQTIYPSEPTITCNTAEYLDKTENGTVQPPAGLFRNIETQVSTSWLDAFTGGPSPYLLIRNLNNASAITFNYSYFYNAVYKNSNSVPSAMFVIGIILVIIEGIGLLRIGIKRLRKR